MMVTPLCVQHINCLVPRTRLRVYILHAHGRDHSDKGVSTAELSGENSFVYSCHVNLNCVFSSNLQVVMTTIHHKATVRIGLVGGNRSFCGKTYMCCVLCGKEFPESLLTTTLDCHTVTDFEVDGERLELEVYDTGGISTHRQYHSLDHTSI